MGPLTERVREVIRLFFPPEGQAEVEAFLSRPLVPDFWIRDAERCALAALKVSAGDVEKLRRLPYECDRREILMAAGFESDVTAHEAWADQVRKGGPASA